MFQFTGMQLIKQSVDIHILLRDSILCTSCTVVQPGTSIL